MCAMSPSTFMSEWRDHIPQSGKHGPSLARVRRVPVASLGLPIPRPRHSDQPGARRGSCRDAGTPDPETATHPRLTPGHTGRVATLGLPTPRPRHTPARHQATRAASRRWDSPPRNRDTATTRCGSSPQPAGLPSQAHPETVIAVSARGRRLWWRGPALRGGRTSPRTRRSGPSTSSRRPCPPARRDRRWR